MILLHKHEDVVDVNIHLTDELQLEHDIVVDVLLLGIPLSRQQTVYIEIDALVVLQIARRQQRIVLRKVVKRREDVPQAQDAAEDPHKVFLCRLS